MLSGFTRRIKPLEILNEDQIRAIHRGSLDVLGKTGVRLEHRKALELLEANGCRIDYDEMGAHFPPGLVEECLRRCPSSFRIKARDPEKDLVMGGNTNVFHPLQAILDNDIAGMVGRFIEGVEITDETLAIDLIHKVGLAPEFRNEEHTAKWWKLEQYVPEVMERLTYPEWLEKRKKG